MSRDLLIAIFVSILFHGGAALSSFLPKDAAPAKVVAEEVPTIEIMTPPPPEPEEPEIVENSTDAPQEVASLAPPMQADSISAVIDSPFVQQIQAPPPPGLNRSVGAITIPTGRPVTGSGGSKLKNVFDLAALDQKPEARVRIKPIYPFEMRRSGLKGEVVVGFIVDSNGDPREPYIVRSSNAGFEEAAIQAVMKWKFKPGKKGGASVNTRVQQPLTFNLDAS
jgi:protein TonB